jgi:methylthioribulose-1-phosphate dehydratase
MLDGNNRVLAQELVDSILFFNSKGWSPATSTNYSVRSENKHEYIISRSGVDKSKFGLSDLIIINSEGEVLDPFKAPGIKSSAETEIHTALYKKYPEVNCVLHTHSLLGTMLSHKHLSEGVIRFKDLEIIKGLAGNETHEMEEILPIVANSQEMPIILNDMEKYFEKFSRLHGFLIAGHGLYTWGKDIPSAKRHIETFEFLFECHNLMRRF